MIGLGLKILGIFGWIKRMVGAVFGWAIKDVRNGLILALGVATAWFAYSAHKQANRATVALQAAADEVAAHAETVSHYDAAAIEAARIQQENLDRVAVERAAAEKEVLNAKQISDSDWRSRFDILRARAAEANSSRSRQTGLSAAVALAGQPAPPDPSPGEPVGPGLVAVRIDDLDTLVRNSIDGKAIQDLVIANESILNSPD